MKVDYWFEFGSTYSYPASMRIEALARERNIELSWRPFLLGPIFKAQGWDNSPFNIYPAKGRYMWRDMERICQAQGLPLTMPSVFPRNGLLAARVACRFSEEPWVPEFIRSVYRANFERDLDISNRDIIAGLLSSLPVDAASILNEAESENAKALLKANTGKAVESGIFGAPSLVVSNELFWGNDRLEAALDWASNAASRSDTTLKAH